MLYQLKKSIKKAMPPFVLGWYHYSLAFLGAAVSGFPSKKIKVIGVTGTNGKSTTIELLAAILKESGSRVAAASSIRFEVAGKVRPNLLKMTMPGRFAIQQILAEAVKEKCEYAVIEVTSEGIKQHRHRFIDFSAAVFTNLTMEHIEAHGGFDNYRSAKEKLFAAVKGVHIINGDDANANHFLKYEAEKKICYSLKDKPAATAGGYQILLARDVKVGPGGATFRIGDVLFSSALLGEFNVYNALAAVATAKAYGIDMETCRKGIARLKNIPGRMEVALEAPKTFVDYAFTPNALEQVYQTLTSDFKKDDGSLICILGACGGGRDKWKRPVLGNIAAKYCDRIILTNEDPYDEDPNEIIAQVKSGVEKTGFSKERIDTIIDRREAIKKGLEYARKQDVVILTGKGSEPWICLENGKKIPWNEKEIIKEEFEKLNKE